MPEVNLELGAIQINNDILAKFKSLDCLRPFPATATQIVTECQNAEADVKTVTQLIECEPSIATKVLSLANSPLYGMARPITTIGHAIVLIGFRSVSQMALAVAAGDVFAKGDPEIAAHRAKTFNQSLSVAAASRVLAKKKGIANADEAFLSGVLQDIGKLVFFDVVPREYSTILDHFKDGCSQEYELSVFGTEHALIGSDCGKRWGMPAQINTAIKNHHGNFALAEDGLTRTIVAANYFARQWQIGFDESEVLPDCEVLNDYLSSANVQDIKDECLDQFQALAEICGVSA